MRLHDPLANGQTEACPLLGMGAGCIRSVKAMEDLRLLVTRDSDPRVGDRQPSRAARCAETHLDGPALFRVLDRVIDEIQDQFAQSHLIPDDRHRLQEPHFDMDFVFLSQDFRLPFQVVEKLIQPDRLTLQAEDL